MTTQLNLAQNFIFLVNLLPDPHNIHQRASAYAGTIFASVTRVLDLQVEENLFDQLECRNSVTTNCFIL